MPITAEPLAAEGNYFPGSPSSSYAMTGTWAELVAAHAATPFAENTRLKCSDVGVNGSDWSVNSSSELFPIEPITLHTAIDSYARAPSGTINTGSSGNITFGTASPKTFSGGFYVYLPAIATTPAITDGYYWCVMSNTTTGTLYESKGGSAINFTVGAGYTGVTTRVDLASYTVKGGVPGLYRRISLRGIGMANNNANTKTMAPYLGSQLMLSQSFASLISTKITYDIFGAGASRQFATPSGAGSTADCSIYANLANDNVLTFSQFAAGTTATDWVMLIAFSVTLFPR